MEGFQVGLREGDGSQNRSSVEPKDARGKFTHAGPQNGWDLWNVFSPIYSTIGLTMAGQEAWVKRSEESEPVYDYR